MRYRKFWAGAIATLLIVLGIPALAQSPAEPPAEQIISPVGQQADRLVQQGNQQAQAGDLTAAIATWEKAVALYQTIADQEGEAATLTKLGAAYTQLERYREAIATLNRYLPLAQANNDRHGEARALGNLGIAYRGLGQYGKSIQVQRQAGKFLLEVGDRPALGQVLLNLGNTFATVGDYDHAVAAYTQSLVIARKQGDRASEALILSNLGLAYAQQGQNEQAIATLTQSLSLAQEVGDRTREASAQLNLGSTYHSQGNQTQAAEHYSKSLALAQQTSHRRLISQALGSLALIADDRNDYPTALRLYQESLAIARSLDDPAAEGMALNNLGYGQFNAGKLAEAETTLRTAIARLDALRPGLSDTYRISIFDTQVHTYSLLLQVLVAAKQPETALEVAEQGRARAFVELLAGRQPTEQAGQVAPVTIAQIRQLARQQNATLVEYALVPDDDFKFRGKQRTRESELLIWVVSPQGQVTLQRVDLKPLWKKNLSLVDVVNASRCLATTVSCQTLAQALTGAIDGVPLPTPGNSETKRRTYIGLQALHQLLIAPISDRLPKNPSDRILFIPHEFLFLVPFPALQAADGCYLIESHTMAIAPSIQVMTLASQQADRAAQPKATKALIVGNPTMPSVDFEGEEPQPLDPLPGAEQEAIAIAKLLRTSALIGDQATEAIVKQQLPTAKLVHLATHGLLEFSSRSSRSSLQGLEVPGAIALAATSTEDGLLTASEILQLSLQADLVVLSACDTGQGRITGDGVIGLSRAFIGAGVPTVLVSLWAVPDTPTAQLMTHFYTELQQQPDKARALRQAILKTLDSYPGPLDWAAFTLIGKAS